MDFHKNLLIVDLETTGLNPKRHEIIQVGAIVLDKKTLKEVSSYASFVKPKKWQTRDPESMQVNGIELSQVKNAPSLGQVIKELGVLVQKPVILSNYGGILDNLFLLEAYGKLGLPYPFDYHTFNIWSLLFPYLAKRNLLTNNKRYSGFGLDGVVKDLKIQVPGTRHDALADCRVEAEVLRRVMEKL